MTTITADQIKAILAKQLSSAREKYQNTNSLDLRLGLKPSGSGYGLALFEEGSDGDGNGKWEQPRQVAFVGYLTDAALPARNRCEALAKEAGIQSLD